MMSEAIKMLKGEYTVAAIKELNMDKAIIFCRTKVDCDNMEDYLNNIGGQRYACIYYAIIYKLLRCLDA